MNKHKVGSWITKKGWGQSFQIVGFNSGESKAYVTTTDGYVTDYSNDSTLLAGEPPQAVERQALSDAIALVQKYKIGVSVSNSTVWSQEVFGSSHNVTIRQLLDKLFPPSPTAQELAVKEEVERIEKEMRALADSLAKLKS